MKGLTIPHVSDDGRHAWHLYVLQIEEQEAGVSRNDLISALKDQYNIGTSVHFIPVPFHPYYQKRTGIRKLTFRPRPRIITAPCHSLFIRQ